jgi:hypothetical protein
MSDTRPEDVGKNALAVAGPFYLISASLGFYLLFMRALSAVLMLTVFGGTAMGGEKPAGSKDDSAPDKIYASRGAPPVIKPIVYKGVRYEAPWSARGTLIALNDKTGKELWRLLVADYRIDTTVETDVQEVYLATLSLSSDGKEMSIVDESGVPYIVNLESRKVRIVSWGVRTRLVDWSPEPKGWNYRVELTVHNRLNRVLLLDGVSVAAGGKVYNNLFCVKVDGRPVQYRGEMLKRAKPDPDEFVKLKPGADHIVVVDLSDLYPVPPGEHTVEVGFDHTNHFSPDAFRMFTRRADERRFEGEGFRFMEKPKPRP